MSIAVKDIPMMAFRRSKNLADYLVHAKLKPANSENTPLETVKCGDRRCLVCEYLKTGDSFTSKGANKSYTINFELNVNSHNVVYLLTCKVCDIHYVGSTSIEFRLRFNDHKSRIKHILRCHLMKS